MKPIYSFMILFFLVSCAGGKERTFIGCTPANNVVRDFLGISSADSVDFIRWRIIIEDQNFSIKCNYGIGKPNTNGFGNGGKWIEMNGKVSRDKNYYSFSNGDKTLRVLELNPNLIHFLDEKKNLLVGTGGFSYTLNNNKEVSTDEINIISNQDQLTDSVIYYGRTPCVDFSINPPSDNCIKMKWAIIFYSDAQKNQPTTYLLNHSNLMPVEYPGKKGTWKIIIGKDGRIIYELKPEHANTATYLLKLDENILAFTDAQGRLLVGNEDFSFTLSRK